MRGTRVLNGGRYYWEIAVYPRIYGTSMMFGIGTKKARLQASHLGLGDELGWGWVNLLGEDEHSWALSHKGLLWHRGEHKQYTKAFTEHPGVVIGLYFDGILGTLTYFKDDVCLGVAFTNLQNVTEPLFPIVCSSAHNTMISVWNMKREYMSLQDRCRAAILSSLCSPGLEIDQLNLPHTVKQFIREEWIRKVRLSRNLQGKIITKLYIFKVCQNQS